MELVVGIGEFESSNNPADVIKTFALSTCVGLIFYSAQKHCMGMSHIQLPFHRDVTSDASPSRFADTAPAFMLQEMTNAYGVTKGELLISLYGGIDPRDEKDCFRVGEKNVFFVKRAIKQLGLSYCDADTGGSVSRTLVASVGSGIVEVVKRPMNLNFNTPIVQG